LTRLEGGKVGGGWVLGCGKRALGGHRRLLPGSCGHGMGPRWTEHGPVGT